MREPAHTQHARIIFDYHTEAGSQSIVAATQLTRRQAGYLIIALHARRRHIDAHPTRGADPAPATRESIIDTYHRLSPMDLADALGITTRQALRLKEHHAARQAQT